MTRKSTTGFPTTIEEMRTLPISPSKGGSDIEFSVFVNKIQLISNKVC